MTEKERVKRKERYADYKLAYAAFISCYPFGLEDIDGEEWRDIKDYEGKYQISNYGRFKSFCKGKIEILKPKLHICGYLYAELCACRKAKKCKIHRLVAQAFIPNPDNLPTVDHILGNKFDNFVVSLRWVTQSANNQYAYDIGLKKSGGGSYQAKLTDEQAAWCRNNYISGDKYLGVKGMAENFGVNPDVIYNIVSGKTYRNAK